MKAIPRLTRFIRSLAETRELLLRAGHHANVLGSARVAWEILEIEKRIKALQAQAEDEKWRRST